MGFLKKVFQEQGNRNWEFIQSVQPELKRIFIEEAEKSSRESLSRNPGISPPFDVSDPKAQTFMITPEIADRWKIRGHFKEFVSKARFSTAGIRAFIDVARSENPEKMYNDLFLALLVETEAEFVKEVHKEISQKISGIKDIDKHISETKKSLGEKSVKEIEKIYGMPFDKILPFIRENAVKLVGGEVRVHTAKFCAMEARMLASRGVRVIGPKDWFDSGSIYMYSFLSYILGSCGATYYTSSHSPCYLYGRKSLAPDGGQLLPDVYGRYIEILGRIIDEIYGKGKYEISLSAADDPRILKTISYEGSARLFAGTLNITQDEVETINTASKTGLKIILNCLGGSTYKTFSAVLKELGIGENVFDMIFKEEDPFFPAGYQAIKDGERFVVEHYGIDTTYDKVVKTTAYRETLRGRPVGTMVFECDPDSDRFVLKQIVKKEDIPILESFGVGYIPLGNGLILAMPTPNKSFLALDIIDKEKLESEGIWEDFTSLYYITYVSTGAWSEFADACSPHMKKVMAMVGFKNLTYLQRTAEEWYFESDKREFLLEDQLGNKIPLDRTRPLRLHCKEEESGGRVAGTRRPCVNILGQKVLAMPEKSAVDSAISMLLFASERWLEKSEDCNLMRFLQGRFEKYGLKSKIDIRIDINHGEQAIIASLPYDKQMKELSLASARKDAFNNFAFSLGKAVKDGKLKPDDVSRILIHTAPEYDFTWKCLDGITMTEEDAVGGGTRPEGVPMTFSPKGKRYPLFTEVDFRPSGTDPLKSKVYIDAEKLSPQQIRRAKKAFTRLAERDLYAVLERFGIKSVFPEPGKK